MKPYIKDLQSGNIRPYGSNHHDSLLISQDGTYLTYEHLQCGDGSIAGDKENSGFVFCDDKGHTPEEDEILCRYGADAYFNIGGWEEPPKWIPISERLPEDGTWNLFTDGKSVSVERYKSDAIDHFYPNGRWFSLDEAIAWMPLPKPYEPQESEGKE